MEDNLKEEPKKTLRAKVLDDHIYFGLIAYVFFAGLAIMILTIFGVDSIAVIEFFKLTCVTAMGSIAGRFNSSQK